MSKMIESTVLDKTLTNHNKLLLLADSTTNSQQKSQKFRRSPFRKNKKHSSSSLSTPPQLASSSTSSLGSNLKSLDLSYTDDIGHLVHNNNQKLGLSDRQREIDNEKNVKTEDSIRSSPSARITSKSPATSRSSSSPSSNEYVIKTSSFKHSQNEKDSTENIGHDLVLNNETRSFYPNEEKEQRIHNNQPNEIKSFVAKNNPSFDLRERFVEFFRRNSNENRPSFRMFFNDHYSSLENDYYQENRCGSTEDHKEQTKSSKVRQIPIELSEKTFGKNDDCGDKILNANVPKQTNPFKTNPFITDDDFDANRNRLKLRNSNSFDLETYKSLKNSLQMNHIEHLLTRMDTFPFKDGVDEEFSVDSPKKIATDHKLSLPISGEINSNKFLSNNNSTSNKLIKKYNEKFYEEFIENLFLIDSQKSLLFDLNQKQSIDCNNRSFSTQKSFCDESNSSGSANETNQSSVLKIERVKSETDLRSNIDKSVDYQQKNNLSKLNHLREKNTVHDDSFLNRIRKFRISGRSFTSSSSSSSQSSPLSKNNFSNDCHLKTSKKCSESESIHKKVGHNDEVDDYRQFSKSDSCKRIDINQNQIDSLKDEDLINEKLLPVLNGSSLSPRESRRFINTYRKSMKKSSRRYVITSGIGATHSHLKRSQTQPFERGSSFDEAKRQSLNRLMSHEDSDIIVNNNNNHHQSPLIDLDDDLITKQNNSILAEAIFDFVGSDTDELSFRAGNLIEVTDTSHKQWWWGVIKSPSSSTVVSTQNKTLTFDIEAKGGWFPATYVRRKVNQEETVEESLENASLLGSLESHPQMRTSISKLSSEQIRSNVILEIINTEKDFVKNLKDVIDGYLKPSRDRKDMFDEDRISRIYGNIEELYGFQSKFLKQLEQCIDWDNLNESRIGDCFLRNEKQFIVYCEFCKNHPLATNELQNLYIDHKYAIFFESCRLLQNMIDISLDGFLLTPIQKICKYPLQLAELLKYTKSDHCDYGPVSEAYKCMQRVAQMVNERKSRFENLEKLICVQEQFENWEGPPLLDTSSLLIHSGEILRITKSSWSKEITLFIFDNLLLIAKKDARLLKKRTYLLRNRIDLNSIDEIISLDDNIKDNDFHIITKNSFKFFYKPKQKWYLFQAKSSEEKEFWLKCFDEERRRTSEDKAQGFFVTEQDKKDAQQAHQNNLRSKKSKTNRKPYGKMRKPDTVVADLPLGFGRIDRNRAGSLPSYIHNEKYLINSYKNRQSTIQKKTKTPWFQIGVKKNRQKRPLTKS
ncbi:huntingtin [Sarcoptes scabiei]|nr:huntingtin [Sarcoptes scabiei]